MGVLTMPGAFRSGKYFIDDVSLFIFLLLNYLSSEPELEFPNL